MKRALKLMGLDTETIRRCAICMYEGEINMVIHASGGHAEVYIDEEKVSIILQDIGPGIKDIDQALREGYSTATQNARDLGFGAGMGLPNMKRYSDEMHIESEIGVGTCITMIIKIPGGANQ